MGIPDLPSDQACNRKVDLVFVIGQHAYYHEHLDVLYGSYPGFIETMKEVFADIDLHVMVVTGDGEWGDQESCPKSMCPADGGCPAYGEDNDYPCWALYEEGALSNCDNTHGAGVVFPAGEDAANKPCGLPDGRRYLEGDEPLFAERFDCIARLGGTGGWFQYGWAIGEAVSVDLQEGCNAGFLREDALLFAVLFTSYDSSPYNPYAWAQRVLEAKGFNQDLVVALGYGWDGGAVEPKLCEPQFPDDGPGAVYSWLEHFDHSFFGSICAPSYVSPFVEAATVAAELCEGGPG